MQQKKSYLERLLDYASIEKQKQKKNRNKKKKRNKNKYINLLRSVNITKQADPL